MRDEEDDAQEALPPPKPPSKKKKHGITPAAWLVEGSWSLIALPRHVVLKEQHEPEVSPPYNA